MSQIQAFDYSVDLLTALLWQYNEAERLQALLQQKQDWYNLNQSEFWTDWETDIFDLTTANDFGLSVWGIILGLSLNVITPAQDPSLPTWGFAATHKNFTHGNFRPGGAKSVSLTREQKRTVLQLRYFQLITRGAVPEINAFLQRIFGNQGSVYVLDGLDMTAQYNFTFTPSSQLLFILQNYDVLPRPAGVKINFLTNVEDAFGFDAPHQNFDNGNFVA